MDERGVDNVVADGDTLRFAADEDTVAALTVALGQARIPILQLVPETAAKRAMKCVPWPPVAARCIIRTLKPHESFDDLMYVSQAYEVGRPGDYFIRAMREIPKELGKGTVKSNLAIITVSE